MRYTRTQHRPASRDVLPWVVASPPDVLAVQRDGQHGAAAVGERDFAEHEI